MIRLVIDNGVQTITEICDDCQCHVNNLEITDIITKVKTQSGITLKDKNGNLLEAKAPRAECKCEHCA
jgi:hypothetical protein